MRCALILAGGSGSRLWPMSRAGLPKQLIPFVDGRSLLELSFERLRGIVPPEAIWVCAASEHRVAILGTLFELSEDRFLGEPIGRDTVNAVGLGAAVIRTRDPDAVVGVFTADHVIRPVDEFRRIVSAGYALAETRKDTLVTFGILPGGPSTAYGYLELGATIAGGARRVERFKEKPDLAAAGEYVRQGPDRYLWNSGMFVWRASTVLDCIRRYRPSTHDGLERIASAWWTPARGEVLGEVYPTLAKISVDYAVMEPASRDPAVTVAAVPMHLEWLDVGSWTSFAKTCPADPAGNRLGGGRHILRGSEGTLVVSSDPDHLIAAVGCKDLVIVHTPDATLVCRRDDVETVKEVHRLVGERYGETYL